MPRVTAPDVINELTLNDQVSGDQVTFQYRLPTTEERVQYNRQLWKRERNKVKSAVEETRQLFGNKIMIGFTKGAFAKLVDGKTVLYASYPADPDYDPEWRALVKKYAGDLLSFLAATVFEGTSRSIDVLPEGDDEEGTGEGEEGETSEEEKADPNA